MGICCSRILTKKEQWALPKELVTQVLTRLPVKSLLRFRCVSKSFRALVDSQSFVNSHLIRAEDRSHLNLIFPQRKNILTNYDSVKLGLSDLGISWECTIEVHGYCNGFFLLLASKVLPVLWNPSTRQFCYLPRLPTDLVPESIQAELETFNKIRMGLGYDSSQGCYKVVMIYKFSEENRLTKEDYQVWIFEFKSNSWRRAFAGLLSGYSAFTFPHLGYFADGFLHWLFLDLGSWYNIVYAFHLARETFSFSIQPDYLPNKETKINLNVLDGSLCISFCNSNINGEALLYVRKVEGVEFKWILLYSVTTDQLPPFLELHNFVNVGVLGYSKDRDKIMLDLDLECVVSYDLQEKCFRPTEIEIPKDKLWNRTKSFVESVVALDF